MRGFFPEIVWRLDVTDTELIFTQVPCPEDWEQKKIELPYNDYNGVFCGHRDYDDVKFSLVRRLKAENFYSGPSGSNTSFKDQWGNFSLLNWRQAHGYGYAWEPSTYYEYEGKMYTTHINFR